MRTGLRISLVLLALFVAMCTPALAADSLSVFTDRSQIALGEVTTLGAHVDTDADFGGGRVALKYKPAQTDCGATPAADPGTDATRAGQVFRVAHGPGGTDIGGQQILLDKGSWRICGWLVDDANGGAVMAQASTMVTVLPYSGSVDISVARVGRVFQFSFEYATSSPTRFFATLQRAGRRCPRNPLQLPTTSIMLTSADGRVVGSDGGLGKSVPARQLLPGRWRVCGWLNGNVGSVGPVTKTFVVPARPRRGGRAGG